jgi:hypothetical protein
MVAVASSMASTGRTSERSVALRVHAMLPLLLLEQGVIAQQLTDTPIAPIPNCARWFCGVARHGGQIVPFFDIALWAGLERATQRAPVMISVSAGQHSLGVLASESPLILPPGQTFVRWQGKEGLGSGATAGAAIQLDPRAWLTEIAAHIGIAPA